MIKFKQFLNEAWLNNIGHESKELSVVSNRKYVEPTHFKSNAKKIGNVGKLELHSSSRDNSETHFTWSPIDKMIHHVVHAAQKDGNELKFLSAHAREGSPSGVKMHQVYSSLIKDHGKTMIGTGHSPGAVKMWGKLHDEEGVEIYGRHPDGAMTRLRKDDKKYSPRGSKDPEDKKIGRMELVAKAKE